MYCKSCGKIIDNDSIYCTHCGAKQSIITAVKENTPSKTEEIDLTKEKPQSIVNSFQEEKRFAISTGVLLIIIQILVSLIPFKITSIESFQLIKFFFGIFVLVVRILVCIWVVNMSKKHKREPIFWGIFSFILPSIALIIFGLLKAKN